MGLLQQSILSDSHLRVHQSFLDGQDTHVDFKQKEQCVQGHTCVREGAASWEWRTTHGLWLKPQLGERWHIVPCGGVWLSTCLWVGEVGEHWSILRNGFELQGEFWVGDRSMGTEWRHGGQGGDQVGAQHVRAEEWRSDSVARRQEL